MTTPVLEPDKVRTIIEAILVTADVPVTPGKLVSLFDGLNGRDIRAAIDDLKEHYQTAGHAFTIIEIAGGYQLASRQEYGAWVRKFHTDKTQPRLSQAALETLSIVAFKQPITRVQVDSIRGVNSGGVLRNLMELSLIRISGRSDEIGKPMLFGTTRDFLILFGLKTLADLPKPRELEELLAAGEKKVGTSEQLDLELSEHEAAAQNGQEATDEIREHAENGADETPATGLQETIEAAEEGEEAK